MQNSECIELFEKHLTEEKKASANTLSSYLRDIRQLGEYLDSHSENTIAEATSEDLQGYIAMLRAEGKSVADRVQKHCIYKVPVYASVYKADHYRESRAGAYSR